MAQFKLVGSLNPRSNGKFLVRGMKKADGSRSFEVEVALGEVFTVDDSLTREIGSLENQTNPANRAEKLYERVS